jgi:hypothetical protein
MRSPVIVVGRFAFKFARNARGRAGNLYEAKLYRTVSGSLLTFNLLEGFDFSN